MNLLKNKVYNKFISSHDYIGEERYKHSLLVAEEMKRLAIFHDLELPTKKIIITGLIHDYAKYIVLDEYIKFSIKYPQIIEELRYPEKIRHAILAPYIVYEELEIDDLEILEAVKYHATGIRKMSVLGEILFIADYTEMSRKGHTYDMARKMADQSLKKTVAYILNSKIEYLEEQKQFVHPLTKDAYMYYKKYL